MFDLALRGGRVVTPDGVVTADIGIANQKIQAIGPELPGAIAELSAAGLVVLPGLIDVHVHFNDPGREDWEGAHSGSRALAKGGGVAFFDMPLNATPCTVGAREFRQKQERLAAASVTDFGLWGGIIPGNRSALGELADLGVVGFKAFLSNSGLGEFPRADDLTLYEGMLEAARHGLPVAVHAESEEITSGLAARLIANGRHDVRAYLDSRPVVAEVEAISRAALLAREANCKLHIVHISSGKGVATALEARAAGTDISLETCPHYLFFTDEDMERIGALAKCAPPLRSQADQSALWDWVTDGMINIIGSDHSPCPPEMKERDSFFDIWGGISGVQSTLNVLLELGSTLEDVARMTATSPAERFALTSKGQIETGYDADLALVNLDRGFTLRDTDLLYRHPVSPYSGYQFHGEVTHTIRRGEVIVRDGVVVSKSTGHLLKPIRERNTDATTRADT